MASGSRGRVSGRRRGRFSDRLRMTSRLHWTTLSRAGRISLAGVVLSAALAVALGVVIPHIVRQHALGARLDAAVSMVRVLELGHVIPPAGDHLTGKAYERFDAVVRDGLLGGENIRVKLWNLGGEVVYSDQAAQVGQRYPIEPGLAAALAGQPVVTVDDLSAAENRLDQSLGSKALEFYVPLRGSRGEVIGAFEIYQDAGPLEAHLAAVRIAVWLAVGTGLSVLFVFLALLFTATAKLMAAEQRAARDRAEDLEVLLRTSRLLSSEPSMERTAPQVLQVLASRLGLRCAAVLVDGPEPPHAFTRAGDARLCNPALTSARQARERGGEVQRTGGCDPSLGHADADAECCVLALPFMAGPGRSGTIVACREGDRPYGARERAVIDGVAGQLGVAAESARLFSGLREMTEARGRLLRKLVDAQEEERRHLVGDLHDEAGQMLTRILYGLRGSRARLGQSQSDVARELGRLESLVDELIAGLRQYMAAIGPALLEDFGLPEALEAFAREQEQEARLRVDIRAGALPQLQPAAAITLFRAAQEAVMNARKHADAYRLRISLSQRDGCIVLEVQDDGRGAENLQDGIGLTYMKDRVASLGGTVDVVSRPGAGTTVTVLVPADPGDGDDSGPRR